MWSIPKSDDELIAALAVPVILAKCFEAAACKWTCRHCGYTETSELTEFCDNCRTEDCSQGK